MEEERRKGRKGEGRGRSRGRRGGMKEVSILTVCLQSLGTGIPQLNLDLGLETERSVSVFSTQACTVLLA